MKKAYSLLFAVLFLATATKAQTWVSDKAHTKIGFTVVHLGLLEAASL